MRFAKNWHLTKFSTIFIDSHFSKACGLGGLVGGPVDISTSPKVKVVGSKLVFLNRTSKAFFKKMIQSRPLLLYIFGLFKQTKQFFQQMFVKNVHPLYGAGIRTHNLRKVSLLPQPLDQGSLI